MKKLYKFTAIITALFITMSCVTAVVLGKNTSARIIKVFEVDGSATVSREEQNELKAYKGMKLENEDYVTVGSDSTTRLSLDNDKFVLLDEETKIHLKASGTIFKTKTEIELISGNILNELTAPLSDGSSYQVKTANATMSVRGTSFRVAYDPDTDTTYLDVYHGTVLITALDPTSAGSVLIKEGESAVVRKNTDGINTFCKNLSSFGTITVSKHNNAGFPSNYENISENIRSVVIESHDNGLLKLTDNIYIAILNMTDLANTPIPSFPAGNNTDNSLLLDNIIGSGLMDHIITTTTATETTSTETTTSETTTSETTTTETTTTETTTTTEETTTLPPVNEYTVQFVNNDGTVISTQTIEEGNAAEIPETPVYSFSNDWDGAFSSSITADASKYTAFTGWSSDNTSTLTNIIADTTFTAQYDKIIPVLFKNDSSGLTHEESISVGDVLPEIPQSFINDVLTALNITGEYTSSIGSNYADSSETTWKSLVASNGSLTYNLNITGMLEVKFVNNDGSEISSEFVEINGTAAVPADPAYTSNGVEYSSAYAAFSGWVSDNDTLVTDPISENTVFTAQYTKSIPVLFTNTESGLSEETSVSIGDEIPEVSNTFIAQVADALGYEEYNTDITISPDDTSETAWNTLAAADEKLTITLTLTQKLEVKFVNNDGSEISSEFVEINGTAAVPADPAYTSNGVEYSSAYAAFSGWISDNDTLVTDPITENIVFTAQYTKQLPVKFVNEESGLSYTETISIGDTVPTVTDEFVNSIVTMLSITKNYEVSTSVSTTDTSEESWNTLAAANQSIVVTVDLLQEYTVTFNNHDNTLLNTVTVLFGNSVTPPVLTVDDYNTDWDWIVSGEIVADKPSDSSYDNSNFLKFKGWTSDGTSTLDYITGDTVFTADYEQFFNVTFTGYLLDENGLVTGEGYTYETEIPVGTASPTNAIDTVTQKFLEGEGLTAENIVSTELKYDYRAPAQDFSEDTWKYFFARGYNDYTFNIYYTVDTML